MFLYDTNFLITLEQELALSVVGPARRFIGKNGSKVPLISIISVGELSVGVDEFSKLRKFISKFKILGIKPELAFLAGRIDSALIKSGGRLGENDNWIAATARYYSVTLVSGDKAFARVPGLKVNNFK